MPLRRSSRGVRLIGLLVNSGRARVARDKGGRARSHVDPDSRFRDPRSRHALCVCTGDHDEHSGDGAEKVDDEEDLGLPRGDLGAVDRRAFRLRRHGAIVGEGRRGEERRDGQRSWRGMPLERGSSFFFFF